MVQKVLLVVLLAILRVSAGNTKIELVSESAWNGWSTFNCQFVSSLRVTMKLCYYHDSTPGKMYIKSIDDRSNPVDCAISKETVKSLNLREFYINFYGEKINKSIAVLNFDELVNFGSNKLLLSLRYTADLVIIDPDSCSVKGVISRKDRCLKIVTNPDSFDCFDLASSSKSYRVTRYGEKGEVVRSFDVEFGESDVSEIHRLEEPYGDTVYYSWKSDNDDVEKTKFIEFNTTYGIVREIYLPVDSYHFFAGVSNFDHGRVTSCPYPLDKQAYDYLLVHCKSVEIKNPSKLVEFSFKATNHGRCRGDETRFNNIIRSRVFVKNLKRGAFVIYRAPWSRRLYYRYVNEAGVIDEEDQLFYELDEHFDPLHLSVKIYEKNNDICAHLHSGKTYKYTKCIKLLL